MLGQETFFLGLKGGVVGMLLIVILHSEVQNGGLGVEHEGHTEQRNEQKPLHDKSLLHEDLGLGAFGVSKVKEHLDHHGDD